MEDYSVLMTVYQKENPEFLRQSLESMFSQTLQPSQVVLSCDGKLTDGLYKVIKDFQEKYKEVFQPLFLYENRGTAYAANMGIDVCKCKYIARMDSDDISRPERCEKQVRFLTENPDVDICGTYIEEFDSDTGEFVAVKKTPISHDEIFDYSKRRNPFNNQTIMMKRSFAKKINGYKNLKRCEDYEFVCRMLMNGAKGWNIPEVLVDYRVTKENYRRRSNWTNTKAFIAVRWLNFKRGYSNIFDFLISVAVQMFIFIMPSKLTGAIYKKFLR